MNEIKNLIIKTTQRIFGQDSYNKYKIIKFINDAYREYNETHNYHFIMQQKYEKAHPSHPWLVPLSIVRLEQIIKKNMVMFEWGSGRSTLWFGNKVKKIYSVEHDARFCVRMINKVQRHKNIKLLFIPKSNKNKYIHAVEHQKVKKFDLILIDAHYRNECLKAAHNRLKKGGYIIFDNSDMPEYEQAREFIGSKKYTVTDYNNGIWQTSLYRKED